MFRSVDAIYLCLEHNGNIGVWQGDRISDCGAPLHSGRDLSKLDFANRLEDQRLKHFAYRLIYAAAPDVLSDNRRQQIERWGRDRVLNVDPDVPWATAGSAQTDLEKAREAGGDTDPVVLANIQTALSEMREKWAAVR